MRSKNLFLCLLAAMLTISSCNEAIADTYTLVGGEVEGQDPIAIGTGSSAQNDYDISLGVNAVSNGYAPYGDGIPAIAIGYNAEAVGAGFIAIGNGATATSPVENRLKTGNIAIGDRAQATGADSSMAIGYSAVADSNATAIGSYAEATDVQSAAFGYDAWATDSYAVAIGAKSRAQGLRTTALGVSAKAVENYTTALGYNAHATYIGNVSVGANSVARASNAVAVGYEAKAYGAESIAIGKGTIAGQGEEDDSGKWVSSSGSATAIGSSAQAYGTDSTAVGVSAVVSEGVTNSVAIGYGSRANEDNVVSVGTSINSGFRRIVNLDEGINGTDAVNVNQLKDLSELLGGSTLTNGQWGEKFAVDGTEYDSVADAISSLAGGSDNAVLYDGDDKSTVTLRGTNGTKITNLAAGVNDTDAVNFGQLSSLGDKIASTLGGDFKFENGALTGDFSVQIGDTTYTNISDAFSALSEGWTFNPVDDAQQSGGDGGAGTGEGATPPASSTIKPGDSLTVNAGNDINITQNGDKDYTISVDPSLREEIEEGYTAADSALRTEITEAYQQADSALKADIDKNSETIGEIGSVLGGAENGYKKPAFDTVTANDINVGKINISGSGINMGGANINTGGGNIDMGGGRITNVAGGAIAQGSTDAVNGGQLWDAYQRMDAMGGDIYRRMDDLREDVNIVGAHAAALSGLHPIDYNPYEPTTLSAAVGTYRDEYAVAVGVFHYVRENVMFNLGASLCSDGDIMGRAGVSFTVGKSPDKPKVAGTMNGLRNQVIAMQAKLDELEAEKKQDKETIRRNEETLRKNEEIMKQNAELIRELTKKLEAKR